MSPASAAAERLLEAFDTYMAGFAAITRRAPQRFAARDWRAGRADALERLEIYRATLDPAVAALHELLGPSVTDKSTWSGMKDAFGALAEGSVALELAETFFNSASRRIFHTIGVDARSEFVSPDAPRRPKPERCPLLATFDGRAGTLAAVTAALEACRPACGWQDAARDAALASSRLDALLAEAWGEPGFEKLELLTPLFYRGKGAYAVGRLRRDARVRPLVLAILNEGGRAFVDAVLADEDEASIVFSFTRSYFHTEVPSPAALVTFLKELMPRKPVGELYASIGFDKHGKTELYRDLLRALEAGDERFVIAPGETGMVMLVFTLPALDVVFKVIRDVFAPPKNTARADVLEKYRLVFRHARAGRLADVQEFEHLSFPVSRFDPALLARLLTDAGETARVEGDEVILRHLFTERRLTPLDVYMRHAAPEAAKKAILDFGEAIRDLAKANVFPGDLLPKNFGVTRHGRVVFYDYDEIALLTDVNFRELPPGADESPGGVEAPYWVGERDVFPEEFLTFMGLRGAAREAFLERHADLLALPFWLEMQRRERAGDIGDVYPYPRERRLGAVHPESA